MNILYITAVLKKGDGVSHVVRDLAREALAKGHRLTVLTGQHNSDFEIGCDVMLLPSFAIPFYREYSFPLFVRKKVETIIDRLQPDVIHVHSPDPASYFAKQYAIKKGITVVATHHSDFIRYLKFYKIDIFEKVAESLLKKFYKGFSCITTPSEYTRGDLSRLGVNAKVIGWGTDTELFNPSKRDLMWRRKISTNENAIIVLCAARLVWYKGFKTLIQAFLLLKQEFPDKELRLVIAGSGPIAGELQKMCGDIVLLGNLSSEELARCYASGDIFLFPSFTETFGSVTLEAMASGLPVVVCSSGGSSSLVVHNQTGLLAEKESAESFAEQAKRLLEDTEFAKTLSKNALAFARQQTWSRVFEEVEFLYKVR